MKAILIIICFLLFSSSYSQDSSRIRQIDTLVLSINNSTLPVQRDTIIQDRPELGLKMTTYLAMIVSDKELMKYLNFVTTTMNDNGKPRQMKTSNTFYFHNNKLIKVEEYIIEGDNRKNTDWYFSDNKPLYYTLQSEKAESRANLLLTIADATLKQVIK